MNPENTQVGQVLSFSGKTGIVRDDEGKSWNCQLRRQKAPPVCGDFVRWQHPREGDESGVITAVEDRKNVFMRANRRGKPQVVAANLDQVCIVIAPEPAPTRDLINRYLVAATLLEIPATLVVNKVDLISSQQAPEWDTLLEPFEQLGVPVLQVSAKTAQGTDQLRHALNHKTSILVGQSGTGKTALTNALMPELALKEGHISRATKKGRHTTSTTTLYALPGGGQLIDSPGVWEYGLWEMSSRKLAQGFKDFSLHAERCKFANCSHDHEPGCAVSLAAKSCPLLAQRLASYRRIVNAQKDLKRITS